MQYLILTPEKSFITKWYDYENFYQEGMVVFDLINYLVTRDGKNWEEIEFDHL